MTFITIQFSSLRSLRDFTIETNIGLLKPLEDGDYDGLVSIMGHLSNVRERQMEYDTMFEPLTETLHLLKVYEVEMPEDVFVLMQVLLKCILFYFINIIYFLIN